MCWLNSYTDQLTIPTGRIYDNLVNAGKYGNIVTDALMMTIVAILEQKRWKTTTQIHIKMYIQIQKIRRETSPIQTYPYNMCCIYYYIDFMREREAW